MRDDDVNIEIDFPTVTLRVSEVWPDGDAPANPTAADVLDAMRSHRGGLRRVPGDWELLTDIEVTVTTPNPLYVQDETLFGDPPPRWITTHAEARL